MLRSVQRGFIADAGTPSELSQMHLVVCPSGKTCPRLAPIPIAQEAVREFEAAHVFDDEHDSHNDSWFFTIPDDAK